MTGNQKRKTCFVAMPITTTEVYLDRCGDSDHFLHVLNHLFRPALEDVGYQVIPPSTAGAELIHAEIIKNLEQADLVLCDLSDLNPNVFFELGIRTALDRPLTIVKDNLTPRLPFDLSAVNILTYDYLLNPWTLSAEIPRLSEHIGLSDTTANAGNAMWRYFGLTKRASPAEIGNNPLEAKVDFIISELTSGRLRQLPESKPYPLAIADSSSESPVTIPESLVRPIRQIEEIAHSEDISLLVRYDAAADLILLLSDGPLPPKMRERIALTTGLVDSRIRIIEQRRLSRHGRLRQESSQSADGIGSAAR